MVRLGNQCIKILLTLTLILQTQAHIIRAFSDAHQHPVFNIKMLEVAAEVNSSEKTLMYWREMATEVLLEKAKRTEIKGIAKNLIMFLGDGMSVPTLAAARIYVGQLNNETGESSQLSFEKFPYSGFSKTYCVDKQVADSACSSTAYLGGVKANMGTLGVTANVTRNNCTLSLDSMNHVDTILSWAQAAGKATGLVTTTRITHASPAGHYAHSAERDWEGDQDLAEDSPCEDIAKQLLNNDPGKNCKVLMGGGRSRFLPKANISSTATGRKDSADLVTMWLNEKTTNGSNASYVTSREELLTIDVDKTDYLIGLFQDEHMLYHLEEGSDEQPTLAEMTEYAIKILSKESNGFYLFVEGGRIDMAHHDNWARRSLDETNEFQKAVQVAVGLVDEMETLIVVTADHAHTMSFAGYPVRGNDILGIADNASDNMPYTTLSYANGISAESNVNGSRHNITDDDLTNSSYRYPSLVPLGSETHGGDDVAVYARGPWAHLLTGNYEQTLIPHVMAYAANIGPLTGQNVEMSTTTMMTTTTTKWATTSAKASTDTSSSSVSSVPVVTLLLSTVFFHTFRLMR